MDDFSLCFEETLISPSVLPRGFSTSLLQLASPWGLGRTFGDSEGLAGGWGRGQAPLSKQDLANHILSPTAAGRGGRAARQMAVPVWPPATPPPCGLRLAGGGREDPSWGFAAVAVDAGNRHATPAAHTTPGQDATARIPDELPGADLLCPPSKAELKRLPKTRWCAQPSAIIICTTSCFLPRAAFILHCFPFQVGLRVPRCSASGAASSAGLPAAPPAAACWRRGHLCLPAPSVRPPSSSSSSCQSYFGKQQLSRRIVNCSSTPFQLG